MLLNKFSVSIYVFRLEKFRMLAIMNGEYYKATSNLFAKKNWSKKMSRMKPKDRAMFSNMAMVTHTFQYTSIKL